MYNDVYYKGSGPAIYGGAAYDIIVQNQGLSGTTANNPHMASGFTGGRRVAARLAATIWGGLTNPTPGAAFPPNASPPSLSRANDSAAGAPSPAFDYTNTYAATFSTATWSGATVTVSGGLAAHARPFVDGQTFSCSGCNSGLYIVAVDAPPTMSNVAGAGQVGNTFHITVSGTIGGSGSGAITAGCATGTGGSNCINFDFQINTTNGTFGTAAAIDTCGVNNIYGPGATIGNPTSGAYADPFGSCVGSGIGSLTRGFRIGSTPLMYIYPFPQGSVFDDGADFEGGGFNRSSAFTCNIVAAKVVQCVHAPIYTSGAPSGIGKWTSGSTWANYGDMSLITGRIASMMGTVGAQSLPLTSPNSPGSGYTNGFYQSVQATCSTVQSGGLAPYFDITVSGGHIVNVYPSAISTSSATQAPGLGVGSACTLTDTNFPNPMKVGETVAGTINIPLAPVEGTAGIMTFGTDQNEMGTFLYGNEGEPGNPLNQFFTNGSGSYFEPGLPVRPFGEFQGAAVSDNGSPAAPTYISLPSISGTAQVGQTLTTSNGTWIGSPTGYMYQWLKASSSISGATTNTYSPVTGDIGSLISVTVTATNAIGSGQATSNSVGPVFGSVGCSQATNYLARTTGGNEGGNAANITTLICGLVTDGVITGNLTTTGCGSTLDALYVLAQQNSSDALLNLCGTNYTATAVGSPSPVFTSYRGYNGFNNDGVYINTAFNPATATSPNYLQNSASIGIWSNAVTAESSAQMSQGSSGRSWIYDNFASDGNFYARINNASTGGLTSPGTKGLFVADRSSSGSVVPYWDGSALTAQSGASSTPYSGAFII
jgi:hypothetical protein